MVNIYLQIGKPELYISPAQLRSSQVDSHFPSYRSVLQHGVSMIHPSTVVPDSNNKKPGLEELTEFPKGTGQCLVLSAGVLRYNLGEKRTKKILNAQPLGILHYEALPKKVFDVGLEIGEKNQCDIAIIDPRVDSEGWTDIYMHNPSSSISIHKVGIE